mgnify:CR=1 FL=1
MMAILAFVFLLLIFVLNLFEGFFFSLGIDELRRLERRYGEKTKWVAWLFENPLQAGSFFSASEGITSTLFFVSALIFLIKRHPSFMGTSWIFFILSAVLLGILFFLFSFLIPSVLLRKLPLYSLFPVYYPIRGLYYIFYPMSWLWARFISPVLGGGYMKHLWWRLEESLAETEEEAEEEKALRAEARDMIRHIADLGEKRVREVMIPRIDMVAVSVEEDLEDAAKKIKDSGHSRIPVYGDTIDEIIGVVYAKDILTKGGKVEKKHIGELMRDPYFVPEAKRVDELLQEMRSERIHMAIVVDEYGGTAGIVTLEDIIEEIVGEIEDEYDRGEELIRPIIGVGYLVAAKMSLEEVNEELGLNLPEEEADTLGGLIYQLKGGIPKEGEVLEYEKYLFEVAKVSGHRVISVKIKKKKEDEET